MEGEQGQDGLDEFSGAQQSCDGRVAMQEEKRDGARHYKPVTQHQEVSWFEFTGGMRAIAIQLPAKSTIAADSP